MQKKRYKPKVGQILYSLNVGNSARGCEQKLTPVSVESVGTKYFKCLPLGKDKSLDFLKTSFAVETWNQKTDYSCDEELYESPQEWADEFESTKLITEIREVFSVYGRPELSLETLRSIRSFLPNVKAQR